MYRYLSTSSSILIFLNNLLVSEVEPPASSAARILILHLFLQTSLVCLWDSHKSQMNCEGSHPYISTGKRATFCAFPESPHSLLPHRPLKPHRRLLISTACRFSSEIHQKLLACKQGRPPVASSPLPSLTQTLLGSNLSRHGPVSVSGYVGVSWYARFVVMKLHIPEKQVYK